MEAQVGALRWAAEQSIVAYEMMHWSGWVPRRLLPRAWVGKGNCQVMAATVLACTAINCNAGQSANQSCDPGQSQVPFTATPAATTAAATTVRTPPCIGVAVALLPGRCTFFLFSIIRVCPSRRCALCPAKHNENASSLLFAGGSYYERSGRGGFGSARAAEREREAKPKQPARTAAGGGLGAALRKLFCFG